MSARGARPRLEADGHGAVTITTPRGRGWRDMLPIGLAFSAFMPLAYVLTGGLGHRDPKFEGFMWAASAGFFLLTAVIAAGGYLAFRDQVVVLDRYRQTVTWRGHRRVPTRIFWFHEVAGLEIQARPSRRQGGGVGPGVELALRLADGGRIVLGTFNTDDAGRSEVAAAVACLEAEAGLPIFDMRGEGPPDDDAWRLRAIPARVRAAVRLDESRPGVVRLGGYSLVAELALVVVGAWFPLIVTWTIVALVFERLGIQLHGYNYEGPMDLGQGRALTATLGVTWLVIVGAAVWLARRASDAAAVAFDLGARQLSFREGVLHGRRTVGFDRIVALAIDPARGAGGGARLVARRVDGRRVALTGYCTTIDPVGHMRWLAAYLGGRTGIPYDPGVGPS